LNNEINSVKFDIGKKKNSDKYHILNFFEADLK